MAIKHLRYEQLEKNIDQHEIIDQLSLSMTINYIKEKEISNTLLSLMYHHYYLETGQIPNKDVYGAKINRNGKGVLFNISQIPTKLQRIIALFLREESS